MVPFTVKGLGCNYMNDVKRPIMDYLVPHCDRLVLESGCVIYRFYADKTFRSLFERIAFEKKEDR